ncbi:TfoX/Sxy family protein [Rhodoferax bucti]|uniref:TfoX/Sxy family protein n=1 Tax=Rhodoferax bucti TaxID=2576305 RepID=UPI001107B413|nr:TfoX/Sxy family protein [Rhodoferax bucti]
MASISSGFADYCCELLSSLGPCRAKRMFGGWGISCEGLTVAILADLGDGDTLWLKASDTSRTVFEAEGCKRFSYTAKGMERGINYYSAPAEAMESPALMQPWARLALEAALAARKPPPVRRAKPPRGR